MSPLSHLLAVVEPAMLKTRRMWRWYKHQHDTGILPQQPYSRTPFPPNWAYCSLVLQLPMSMTVTQGQGLLVARAWCVSRQHRCCYSRCRPTPWCRPAPVYISRITALLHAGLLVHLLVTDRHYWTDRDQLLLRWLSSITLSSDQGNPFLAIKMCRLLSCVGTFNNSGGDPGSPLTTAWVVWAAGGVLMQLRGCVNSALQAVRRRRCVPITSWIWLFSRLSVLRNRLSVGEKIWVYIPNDICNCVGWLGSVMAKGVGFTTHWLWGQFRAMALSGNSFRQAAHTNVPLSPSSISW